MAASTSNTPRTSSRGNSAAASNGPRASDPFVPNPSAEFALSRFRSRTSAGTAALDAGWKICPATARKATNASNSGSEGNVRAMTATRVPCTSSQATITRLRSHRSLRVPVSGLSSDGAKSPTSNSSATASACPVVSAT